MFVARDNFLVRINSIANDGSIIDTVTKQNIIHFRNNSRDFFSGIINMFTFRLLGKVEWDFFYGQELIFKIYKNPIDIFFILKYNLNGKFYDLYKIESFSSVFPIFWSAKVSDFKGRSFKLVRKNFVNYEFRDMLEVIYCYIQSSSVNIFQRDYFVKIEKFLDGYENYIFLALPVFINLFA